jgi:hypothetical protein
MSAKMSTALLQQINPEAEKAMELINQLDYIDDDDASWYREGSTRKLPVTLKRVLIGLGSSCSQ